jgi:hypothetical protein
MRIAVMSLGEKIGLSLSLLLVIVAAFSGGFFIGEARSVAKNDWAEGAKWANESCYRLVDYANGHLSDLSK